MNKRVICAVLAALCLLLCGVVVLAQENANQAALDIRVNNEAYAGAPGIKGEGGALYFPLDDLSAALGEALSDEAAVEIGGKAYASADSLRAMGLNVYINEGSTTYIDNFPVLDYAWAEENRIVAHGLGGIDGHYYTNSREAFVENYDQGYRVFEVDLEYTADGALVACHDWKRFYAMKYMPLDDEEIAQPPTLAEFQDGYILENLTPLTIDDVIQLMMDYPDAYVTIDTKVELGEPIVDVYAEVISAAEFYDPTVLDRIIPELYSFEMYDDLFELYDWKSAVFSVYRMSKIPPLEDVFDFIYRRGIKAQTLSVSGEGVEFIQNIHDIGGYLYLYTYNDMYSLSVAIGEGLVYGTYSDFLPPDALDSHARAIEITEEMLIAEAKAKGIIA